MTRPYLEIDLLAGHSAVRQKLLPKLALLSPRKRPVANDSIGRSLESFAESIINMKVPMKSNSLSTRMILLATAIQFLALIGRGANGDTWVRKADMPTPRIGLSTCVVNGKIYAIGGYREAGGTGMKTVEAYDPVTDSWTRKTDMPTARLMLACAAVNGKIYAIGGDQAFVTNPMKIVEEYDPTTDTWTRKADMPTARSGPAAAVFDGKIYVIGGLTTFGATPLSTVEAYDPLTDTWEGRKAMPTARGLLHVSVVGGKIFAIGSAAPPSGPWLPTVEMYVPVTDTWSRKANMPTARGLSAGGTAHGRIYVIGGKDCCTAFATVEEYDPLSNKWTKRANMWTTNPAIPSRRWNFSASEVNGRIYAIGGASLVGTTFRRFTGTITITSFRYREPEDAAFEKELAEQRIKRRAVVLGRYTFTEEGSDAHTGTFSGIVYSAVYIDADDKAHYDDIELGADGYLNNQFAGRWRSRDGKLDLVCNWGDYRIPLSGGLDVGDGEFMPAKEYFKNGWQTYYDAYAKQDAAALKEEQRQWWRQTKRTKNK